jgi:hypothetical protein
MHDDQRLALIRTTPRIAELLTGFDVDVTRVADGPPEPITLPGGEPLEMIAGDASGGAFLLVGSQRTRPVVYAGSEGEGGLIAASLRDALALVVGLPSLHDAVSLPWGDDGGRLREWLAAEDEDLRRADQELDAKRAELRATLDLPAASELLEALHVAAADDRYRPVNARGDSFDSMLRRGGGTG